MAKVRDEIVGKRFLSVTSSSKLKLSKITEWDWRAGVIRACTHRNVTHKDLQVTTDLINICYLNFALYTIFHILIRTLLAKIYIEYENIDIMRNIIEFKHTNLERMDF